MFFIYFASNILLGEERPKIWFHLFLTFVFFFTLIVLTINEMTEKQNN